MSPLGRAPAARGDLSSSWDFTKEHWDETQAEIYIKEMRAAIERVAANPQRGRACDEIRKGYRRYSLGSHVIFYIEGADSVAVIRVLNQRMDPTRHL